jgi:hypothetical protein
MLNPHRLNELAGIKLDYPDFPLSWYKKGYRNIALAWEERKAKDAYYLPVAMPATYQVDRMIAQRSCFTVHGTALEPIESLLKCKGLDEKECLFKYDIDPQKVDPLMRELSLLGTSAATIFPDLDHLAEDLRSEIESS